MNARLEDGGNYLEFTDFSHDAAAEQQGNPYNCIFDIRVQSGLFAGIAEDCEYDYKELPVFIQALEDLTFLRRKEADFTEISIGNCIHFEADSTGHIIIAGALQNGTDGQFLRFAFRTDQTVLQQFIRALKKL